VCSILVELQSRTLDAHFCYWALLRNVSGTDDDSDLDLDAEPHIMQVVFSAFSFFLPFVLISSSP
jgi:hypothetical protein